MSEIESSLVSDRSEDLEEEINVDLLIAEVKRRPPLYIKAREELEREKSQKLWTEVCETIFKQWNDFDPKKKKEKENDVQTKWQILKDSFYKTFGGAQTIASSGAKKRKYYYFNSLSFLIPTMEAEEAASLDHNNEGPEIAFAAVEEPRRKAPNIVNVLPSMSTNSTPIMEQPWQFTEIKTTPEIAPPKITQEKDDIDENTHFALMLVPMMRKFNDEQRYLARVAILRSMREISLMGQEKISILQDELKYADPVDNNMMQDLNYPVPEAAPFDDGQEYPVPAPIVGGRPTNPQGEIEYPETDTEDVEV